MRGDAPLITTASKICVSLDQSRDLRRVTAGISRATSALARDLETITTIGSFAPLRISATQTYSCKFSERKIRMLDEAESVLDNFSPRDLRRSISLRRMASTSAWPRDD